VVAGESVGSSRAAANEGGTRGKNTGFDAMGAARAEFDDLAARGSRGHTRGLAGDECLKMENGEEASFDELGFSDRCRDPEQGFTRKEDRAFGEGPNFTIKAKLREEVVEV